jgi:hypothetical protein
MNGVFGDSLEEYLAEWMFKDSVSHGDFEKVFELMRLNE